MGNNPDMKTGDYWVHWKHGSSRWCAVWINDERVYFAGDPKAYAIDRFDIGPEITPPDWRVYSLSGTS